MLQNCATCQPTAVASPKHPLGWLAADDAEYPRVGQAMAALHSKMALPRVSEATAACKNLRQLLLEASGLPDSGVGRHSQACSFLSPGSLITVEGSRILKVWGERAGGSRRGRLVAMAGCTA